MHGFRRCQAGDGEWRGGTGDVAKLRSTREPLEINQHIGYVLDRTRAAQK